MVDFPCFVDRVALITGAGGALGGGTAQQFVKYGAKVALIDIDQGRLDGVVEKLREAGCADSKILAVKGDVTKVDDVQSFVLRTVDKLGTIQYLINIVGQNKMGDIETSSLEELEECLSGCVRSTFIVSQAVTPYLIQSKGCIVNMSSVGGVIAFPSALPCGTAKAAVNHMTRIMAMGLAKKGVRANCVCPSTLFSDFNMVSGHLQTQEELNEYLESAGRAIPIGRIGCVDDVTKTILYLCSDAASFITGVVIPIDGAYTLSTYIPPPE